jgi:hypothetical protein
MICLLPSTVDQPLNCQRYYDSEPTYLPICTVPTEIKMVCKYCIFGLHSNDNFRLLTHKRIYIY